MLFMITKVDSVLLVHKEDREIYYDEAEYDIDT